jgi:hypothetical protein
MPTKRVLLCSDSHCGHRSGLTPPAWQLRPSEDAEMKRSKWVNGQRETWKWFVSNVSKIKPIDHLIINGDLIDGTGWRSGGTELITTDRNVQIDMAIKWIRWVGAKSVHIIRGTPYHAGQQEDLEDIVASELQCSIGDHEWFDINGVVFDCKHKIAGSTIPHGRVTPLLKAKLWNGLWAAREAQPKADVIIRGHVHYYLYAGGIEGNREWRVMSLPALQGMGTKYGAKECEGTVDYGFVFCDIDTKGNITWESRIAELQSQKAQALKL